MVLPSYDEVKKDRRAFAQMSRALQLETSPHNGRPLLQAHGDEAVYLNRPGEPLRDEEMDALYDLPFQRRAHPSYAQGVPALETVKHSIVTMRGCFGGCSFCSLTEHQGRVVQSRSEESVLREVRALAAMGGFAGVVSDLGGPTANMYKMRCKDEEILRVCRRLSCVYPDICDRLDTDHGPLLRLMKGVRTTPGIKKVFLASGVRHDLAERSPELIRELARHHTGGQLSVAPEHTDPKVLEVMRKPPIDAYERFAEAFSLASREAGKEQYLVPYFISGHPGSTLKDAVDLALYLKAHGMRPRQVQDFIPTPMSMATAMFHTGMDPLTMQPIHVATDLREKRMMKALLLYWDPASWALAREALVKAGRRDLIGRGAHCLVPPDYGATRAGSPHPPGPPSPSKRGRGGRRRRPSCSPSPALRGRGGGG